MAIPIIMPKFGMTQEEATVLRWLRQEGDTVEQGDPLLEVETDKVVMEVEAPASGLLGGILVQKGDVVPVTEVIAFILQPGEKVPDEHAAPVSATEEPQVRRATPVAQRMAVEAGIDLNQVPTSDPAGKIKRQDVENYLAQLATASVEPSIAPSVTVKGKKPRATPAARRVAREHGLDLAQLEGRGPRGRVQEADVVAAIRQMRPEIAPPPGLAAPPGAEVVPLQGMRRTIATRMKQSYQTAPHITLTVEADMSAAQALRHELNARAETVSAPRISFTAILVKVCAWALQRHRWVNASLRSGTGNEASEEAIHLHEWSNVGVAVALDEGLIVPVVRQAERLGIAEIARQLQDLTDRARQGLLTPDDVSGGTFTITNLGMYGIEHFTAIINPPESAILAVGRIAKRAIVMEREAGDEVVIRPMMHMTLSADHRVLDGAVAARFLQDVVEALEHPSLLLW